MSPEETLIKLGLVAAEGVVLFVLSRGLFAWVLQALASSNPRRRGGWPVQLIRLPGNFVHELSHALAFLICGYRVKRLVLCLLDRAGAGVCQPGRPWSPIALPWLATGLAALAPLFTGALVLWGLAHVLGVPLEPPISLHAPGRTLLQGLSDTLLALDYDSWRTWLFLYLAFTIGAELAPSQTDIRAGIPALLALSATLALYLLGLYQLSPTAPLRVVSLRELDLGLTALSRVFSFALVTTAAVTALTFVPASLVRMVRR